MRKHNYFVQFSRKSNLFINRLLKRNLNKLNFSNLSIITRSNKVFLIFVVLIILFLSYLSIPRIYNKAEVREELKSQLLDKFRLNFVFTKNFNYKFFPRPHFIIEDTSITEGQVEVSDIKKLSIFISLDNLFSLKNIAVKDVILENTNFNLNKQNSKFFMKLLDSNFFESSFNIKDSNIFFRNADQEVLFINKIIKMKYYYDSKESNNIFNSENEIFNIKYSFRSHKNKFKKKIFSKINFDVPKLQIENEFNYIDDKKKGLMNFIYDKNKSEASYEWGKNYFNFNFLDKSTDPKFFYKGNIDFNPFYSVFSGNTDKLNLSSFFISNSLFVQFFKTQILNNKNLNIDLNIDAKKVIQFQNIINVILNFKIKEGLIDIDNTKFSWSNYIDFVISDSLLFVNENQLMLDGKFIINVKNYKKIYKFLQISRNLRPKLAKLEFNFKYNFDQQIIDFNDVKINNQANEQVANVLKKIILKQDKLQNKIYIKNLIKKAIVAYVG